MVDKKRLMQELRNLKQRIQQDPEVLALYDIDGDGEISGHEWDMARKATIAHLEAEEARKAVDKQKLEQTAGPEVVSGLELAEPAERVYQKVREARTESLLPDGHPFSRDKLVVKQLESTAEMLFNVESTNAYRILTTGNQEVGFAAEMKTGLMGTLARNFWGSRRSFNMRVRIHDLGPDLWIKREFDFILSRLIVSEGQDPIGEVKQRFAFFSRRYDLTPFHNGHPLRIHGPVFKPWTFLIKRGERELGSVKKKWGGLLREGFTREDTFMLSFDDQSLTPNERKLILAASIAIDLDYFERRSN